MLSWWQLRVAKPIPTVQFQPITFIIPNLTAEITTVDNLYVPKVLPYLYVGSYIASQ